MYLFMLISWLHDVCVGNKKAMEVAEAKELAQPEELSTKNADGANSKTVTKTSVKAKKRTKRNRKESDKVKSSTCITVHVIRIHLFAGKTCQKKKASNFSIWTLGSPAPPNITTSLTAKQTSAEQTTLTAKQTSACRADYFNCQADISRADYFNCQAGISRTDYFNSQADNWQANIFIGRTYIIILIEKWNLHIPPWRQPFHLKHHH